MEQNKTQTQNTATDSQPVVGTPESTPKIKRSNDELSAAFAAHLTQVAQQIHARFPENTAVVSVINQLGLLGMSSSLQNIVRSSWRDITTDFRDDIMHRRVNPVYAMFEQCNNSSLKDVGIHIILQSPDVELETKDALWQYMQLLTVLAHANTPTEILTAPVATSYAAHKPIAPPPDGPIYSSREAPAQHEEQAQPPQQPAAPVTPEKMIKTFLDAAPKVVETFNKMVKDDDGSNVVAQMIKQFLNPNALQSGLAPNLMANAMDMQGSSQHVMQAVQSELGNLDPSEVVRRLKKLERLEELKRRRNQQK